MAGFAACERRLQQELVETFRSAYGIDFGSDLVDLGGSSNLNLRVCAGDDCYVVRTYRPYVTADRLREIHFVRQRLSAAGMPCGGLVPTRDGQPWILLKDLASSRSQLSMSASCSTKRSISTSLERVSPVLPSKWCPTRSRRRAKTNPVLEDHVLSLEEEVLIGLVEVR